MRRGATVTLLLGANRWVVGGRERWTVPRRERRWLEEDDAGRESEDEACLAGYTSLGFNIFDFSKYDEYFGNTSFIQLAEAGTYTGADAIEEYVRFATPDSPYFLWDELVYIEEEYLGFINGSCAFSTRYVFRSALNDTFTRNGYEVTRAGGVKTWYSPSRHLIEVVIAVYDTPWLETFIGELDTEFTARYACETLLLPHCSAVAAKNNVSTVDECLELFWQRPLVDYDAHVDGDTRGCRYLHAIFARQNEQHCEHLSFVPLTDHQGITKCQTSKGVSTSDLITDYELDQYADFKTKNGIDSAAGYHVVSTPREYATRVEELRLQAELVSLTSCLVRRRDQNTTTAVLPDWVDASLRENLHVVDDEFGNSHLVLTLFNWAGWLERQNDNELGVSGSWEKEVCVGFLAKTAAETIKESTKKIQALRCWGGTTRQEELDYDVFDYGHDVGAVQTRFVSDAETLDWRPGQRGAYDASSKTSEIDEYDAWIATLDGSSVFSVAKNRDLKHRAREILEKSYDDEPTFASRQFRYARGFEEADLNPELRDYYYGTWTELTTSTGVPDTVEVYPVEVNLNPAVLATSFGWTDEVSAATFASNVHLCFATQYIKPEVPSLAASLSIQSRFNTSQTAEASYLSSSLLSEEDDDPLDDADVVNLECKIADAYDVDGRCKRAEGLYEPSFARKVRTVTAALDLSYVFLVALQRHAAGAYPSHRFDGMRTAIHAHAATGSIAIYVGTYLHIANEVKPVCRDSDRSLRWRRILYAVLALAVIAHSSTVFKVLPMVMGEKRITMPLYLGAGLINLVNAITLLMNPNLRQAFRTWMSLNTFIFVRFNIIVLGFAYIDWELNYTYAILASAATTYPLSLQDPKVYLLLLGPALYGPFHERCCAFFGWDPEDHIGGNVVKEKNTSFHDTITSLVDEVEHGIQGEIAVARKLPLYKRRSSFKKPSSVTVTTSRQGLRFTGFPESLDDTPTAGCSEGLRFTESCSEDDPKDSDDQVDIQPSDLWPPPEPSPKQRATVTADALRRRRNPRSPNEQPPPVGADSDELRDGNAAPTHVLLPLHIKHHFRVLAHCAHNAMRGYDSMHKTPRELMDHHAQFKHEHRKSLLAAHRRFSSRPPDPASAL